MLKYERIAKQNKIAVNYNDRRSLFTRDFTFALALAIALHLSFIFLFTIKDIGLLFSFRPSQLNFNVESDLMVYEVSSDAAYKQSDSYLPEPSYDEVVLALLPRFIVEKHFDESLLHISMKADPTWFDEPVRRMHPEKLEINLYHDAATRKIVNKEQLPLMENIPESGYAKFGVQIDDREGKVIWSELKSSSGNKILIQKASQLLHALQFDAMADSFVTLGEVEVLFHD